MSHKENEIKILTGSLRARKGHCTREKDRVNAELNEIPINLKNLESAVERLKSKHLAYQQAFEELEIVLIREEHDSLMDEQNKFKDYDDSIHKLFVRANVVAKGQEKQDLADLQRAMTLPHASPKTHIKLPPVALMKFNGELREWTSFWANFKSLVHDNDELTPSTKFAHLRECLKGEAYEVVRHYPCDDTSYDLAIKKLEEAYSNPIALEEHLLYKLFDTPSPKYTVADLNTFVHSYESILASLKKFQPKIDESEWIIKRIIARKIPKEVRTYLELKHKKIHFKLSEITEALYECIKKLKANGEDENPVSLSPEERKFQSTIDKRKREQVKGDRLPLSQNTTKRKTNLPPKSKIKGAEASHRSEAVVNSGVQNPQTLTKKTPNVYYCVYCGGQHNSAQCKEYNSLKSRQTRLINLERCVTCTRKGHRSSECQTLLHDCRKCKTPHHNALCPKTVDELQAVKPDSVTATTGTFSVKSCVESCSTALPTATAKLGSSKASHIERVFFDQGSQCTIISSALVKKMGLEPVRHKRIAVSGLLKDSETIEYPIVQFTLTLGRCNRQISAIVLERAVAPISVPGLSATYKKLRKKGVRLADRNIVQDLMTDIGLTVGADYYGDYVYGIVKKHGINLCKTSGGHMIYGPLQQKEMLASSTGSCNTVTSNFVATVPIEEEFPNVSKLWELDVIGINPSANKPEDKFAYETYLNSVVYDNHQYWARLPWKPDHEALPTNYRMAVGQLQALRQSLESKGDLETYHKLIQSQLQADFIEIVTEAQPSDGETHYLPHHAVKKDSLTTPLRMVFNCSAKMGKNPSLNDCLMTGPSLTAKLGDALLKFRTHKYAYTADISKAFLRIGLQSCDRDFTRFLWFHNPHDPDSAIVTYRFRSVLFGAMSSPFLLQATLETHLKNSTSPYKDRLRNEMYVDNLQGTTSDSKELYGIYVEANTIMAEANMPLRMWVTNEAALTKQITEDFPDQVTNDDNNVLGLSWDKAEDTLHIKSPKFVCDHHLSKRQLLSAVSSVFDPLGLVSPLTIRGKLLIKQAWLLEVSWDELLPDTFVQDWQEIISDLSQVDLIKFPRSVAGTKPCYLHVFCDASTHAYGAVAYIITENTSQLLTAKARVTPVKSRSLPQLELTAIQVGVQLASYIIRTLADLKFIETYVWSDNEAALQWVRNNKCDTPYVKNRVAVIRELSENFTFLHVGTKENPADLLSRGTDFASLQGNRLWIHGPEWLSYKENWPEQKSTVICIQTVVIQPYEYLFDCRNFNSLSKIVRITNYALQFVENLLKRKCRFKDGLHYWLYSIQQDEFQEEVKILKQGSRTRSPLITNLGLYIDTTDQLLHCRGRVEKSNTTSAAKFPILLPRKHHFTECLIRRIHSGVIHGGTAETLACLRETYWLPKGRQVIKQLIAKCFTCRYLLAKPYDYPGPPVLPAYRVNYSTPFAAVGVDYSGHIIITSPDKTISKYYFCLFTCAATRAIHLELARDMTAVTFLQLFRRFIARRSCPSILVSDNGKYFSANAEFIKKLQDDPSVQEFLQEHRIEWKFIPPRSPWMGGFYERIVGVVKRALKLALFRKNVSEDELQTLLAEIEQRVNNRPLTYIDEDIDNPIPLTPSHLLHGRRLEAFPTAIFHGEEDPTFADHDVLNERFSYLSKILHHWEKIWSKEYIASLREKFYGA